MSRKFVMSHRVLGAGVAAAAVLASTVTASQAGATTLSASPATVTAGGSLQVKGAGWPKRRSVSVFVEPHGAARDRVAVVRTSKRGRFSVRLRVADAASLGRYDVVACTRGCARSGRPR